MPPPKRTWPCANYGATASPNTSHPDSGVTNMHTILTRRDFLSTTAAAGMGLLAAGQLARRARGIAAQEVPDRRPRARTWETYRAAGFRRHGSHRLEHRAGRRREAREHRRATRHAHPLRAARLDRFQQPARPSKWPRTSRRSRPRCGRARATARTRCCWCPAGCWKTWPCRSPRISPSSWTTTRAM